MSIKTKIFISKSTNPWFNLAYEEQLVGEVAKDEVYLYLWQNQHTVVIGKHQNPWREILVSDLEKDLGKVARRLSGGGAVYHDLGNLNFTFVMNKKNEDLHKQLKVIVEGVKKLGIDAEFSGRNDILAEGRKFSGNAFYYGKENYYHHGTILVDVDMSSLGKYLNVSMKKLNAKGVESVKSRVINLKELNPNMTIQSTMDAVSEAFEEIYGIADSVTHISEETASENAKERYHHYASWDWRFGKTPAFDVTFEEKFAWGELILSFKLKGAIIEESGIFSDAMSTDLVEGIDGVFNGVKLEREALVGALKKASVDEAHQAMLDDVSGWLSTLPV
ncbi:MAG: lipoate--protein ligase [Clostridiales bacterium]|nr:lipoate--protein ligase [Clostridiales bacterium]